MRGLQPDDVSISRRLLKGAEPMTPDDGVGADGEITDAARYSLSDR